MKKFWGQKKVLITGGGGFVGSHVAEKLVALGARVRVSTSSLSARTKDNLKNVRDDIELITGDARDLQDMQQACKGQDIVMNLAAVVGGIEYNRTHQASMLRDNLLIATSVIEAARRANVERFLVVSSACVYPLDCKVPTPESEGFVNEPEPTNGGYGWAKRVAEKLGIYYAEEFGMKVAIVRPYNCYGPRDHFDPQMSHVIPALIRRVAEGEDPLVVWGSGNQTRAFLFVEDLAQGMIDAIEKYAVADPVNLGTDEEVSVRDLVAKIVSLSDKNPEIQFDATKPDGSPRRNSNNAKALNTLQFHAQTRLDEGLEKTIRWYSSQKI